MNPKELAIGDDSKACINQLCYKPLGGRSQLSQLDNVSLRAKYSHHCTEICHFYLQILPLSLFMHSARFPKHRRAAYQIPWLCSSLPLCCFCPSPCRLLTASPSPASLSAAPLVPDCRAAALYCCCPVGRCWDGRGKAGEVCHSSPGPCSRDCRTKPHAFTVQVTMLAILMLEKILDSFLVLAGKQTNKQTIAANQQDCHLYFLQLLLHRI